MCFVGPLDCAKRGWPLKVTEIVARGPRENFVNKVIFSMPKIQGIKKRIESIKETRKITNAMYLISSTKMRKAKADLDRTRPYFEALRVEIKRIFRQGEMPEESRYFYPVNVKEKLTGTFACLLITGDKGLAGAYNYNVIKKAMELYESGSEVKWYVVGEYGRQLLKQRGISAEKSFLYTAQNPTMHRARQICNVLLEDYEKGAFTKIYVAYTDMHGMSDDAMLTRILPFHRKEFATTTVEEPVRAPFEYTPSVEVVLDNIMQSYIAGFIYSALVDSFCSEQHARMTAMKAANDNAEKLISDLSVQYNRMRQAAITQEITEVAAGARAQLKNKGDAISE